MNSNRHALIIDDDESIAKFVVSVFREAGYNAESETDPTKAIGRLQAKNYRLAVLDIDMPEMNGIEVLRAIKSHDPTIGVIMNTGYGSLRNLTASYREGADYINIKPILDISRLLALAARVFERQERWEAQLNRLQPSHDD